MNWKTLRVICSSHSEKRLKSQQRVKTTIKPVTSADRTADLRNKQAATLSEIWQCFSGEKTEQNVPKVRICPETHFNFQPFGAKFRLFNLPDCDAIVYTLRKSYNWLLKRERVWVNYEHKTGCNHKHILQFCKTWKSKNCSPNISLYSTSRNLIILRRFRIKTNFSCNCQCEYGRLIQYPNKVLIFKCVVSVVTYKCKCDFFNGRI